MLIYVAGHRGLVGSAIVREIEAQGTHTWVGESHSNLDLLDRSSTLKYVLREKPDAMIIAAAVVGGIGANASEPVRFLSENLQIQTNLIDAAHAANIERVIFLGSSCIYPKYAPQPIREDSLLTGLLEPTNEAYAIAKISGVELIKAYRNQFRRNWVSAMPTNLYGINDNFDLKTSHVLPALIGKFHEAKISKSESVQLWGTGQPLREFLFADDLANAVLYLLDRYDSDEPINIGTGEDLSISALAKLISEIVGFTGSIYWDETKPDGTPRKVLDVSKMKNLGWSPTTDLTSGIKKTYDWYLKNVVA